MVRDYRPSVQEYIERACDPSQFEPDLALSLEIAEMINTKKGNVPREAAVHLVRLINHRNSHVAMLALNLLDICVKNCGYPFHLQISTKEFLNELVKKFPEKPPVIPPPVQIQVLSLIHEWKTTICTTSKFKDDFVHIRDMHRLLSYKGYRFPNTRPESAAVLNQQTQLRSAEELEEEDRVAQSAKLQELIRRGTPKDLEQANELMKVMAGYDLDQKPDYKKQSNADLDTVQQKAILLNDMLNNVNPGERFTGGDVFDELVTACKNVQPKLQRLIGESDETDSTERLLSINDLINNVLERFERIKKGDFTLTASLNPSENSSQKGTDLIDFDAGGSQGASGNAMDNKTSVKPENLIDDLIGLSFDDSSNKPFGMGGSIALGGLDFSNNGYSQTTITQGSSPFTLPSLQQTDRSQKISSLPTHASNSGLQAQITSQQMSPPSYSMLGNSFDTLTTSTPSPVIGLKEHHRTDSSNSFGQAQSGAVANDDDWGFVSATSTAGPIHEMELYNKGNLRIMLECSKPNPNANPQDLASIGFKPTVILNAKFTNLSSTAMKDLTFRVAVPKTILLKMELQSSQTIPPLTPDGVTQIVRLCVPPNEKLRIRYKITYVHDGKLVDESGQFESFPFS